MTYWKRVLAVLLVIGLGAPAAQAQQAGVRKRPDIFSIRHEGRGFALGIAGNVYYDDPTFPPFTNFAIAGQLNAHAMPESNQMVWGIATEAWSHPNSNSVLVGVEATTVNMEPDNPNEKYTFYATYKNRPDSESTIPSEPMNMASVALRIESQPGTGYERAISFGEHSLYPSRHEPNPIVIDYTDVPMDTMRHVILVRFPDGWCKFYLGGGQEETRVCPPSTRPEKAASRLLRRGGGNS